MHASMLSRSLSLSLSLSHAKTHSHLFTHAKQKEQNILLYCSNNKTINVIKIYASLLCYCRQIYSEILTSNTILWEAHTGQMNISLN
jgi:hypothetical protein